MINPNSRFFLFLLTTNFTHTQHRYRRVLSGSTQNNSTFKSVESDITLQVIRRMGIVGRCPRFSTKLRHSSLQYIEIP